MIFRRKKKREKKFIILIQQLFANELFPKNKIWGFSSKKKIPDFQCSLRHLDSTVANGDIIAFF